MIRSFENGTKKCLKSQMFGFQVFGIQMITVFIDRAVMYYVTKMWPRKVKHIFLPQDKLKGKVFYIT